MDDIYDIDSISGAKVTVEEGTYPAFGFAAAKTKMEPAPDVQSMPKPTRRQQDSNEDPRQPWKAVADEIDKLTVEQLRELKRWMQENT